MMREHLLIVGTLGGGGIHRYVEEQHRRLGDRLSTSVYDMASDTTGTGLVWLVTSIVRSLWAAIKFPFRRPPDVVHVHTSHRFSFYRASFYVFVAAYLWRRPVLLHIHGSSFDEFLESPSRAVRALQSAVFAAVDRIIVLSEGWRDVLAPRVEEEKLHVLPNAVDPDEYEPRFDAEPPHVVFVSNLIRRKGVLELVEAVETLAERDLDARVSIAGKGPRADRVEALADRHEHVTYLGYVSEERKRELLSEGSIFVLPTHAENLPIAMLEGMAGGNAIVSTTVGAIPEVIGDDRGVLVDPGDADQLANALEALLIAPDEVEEMARRNRAAVESEYSWSETTDRLERLYEFDR